MLTVMVRKELRETLGLAGLALLAYLYIVTAEIGIALLPWIYAGRETIPFVAESFLRRLLLRLRAAGDRTRVAAVGGRIAAGDVALPPPPPGRAGNAHRHETGRGDRGLLGLGGRADGGRSERTGPRGRPRTTANLRAGLPLCLAGALGRDARGRPAGRALPPPPESLCAAVDHGLGDLRVLMRRARVYRISPAPSLAGPRPLPGLQRRRAARPRPLRHCQAEFPAPAPQGTEIFAA